MQTRNPAQATPCAIRALTPSALAEWEASPTTAWLRYAMGRGALVPRPVYSGYALGSAVDHAMKDLLGRPRRVTPWPGACLLRDAEPRVRREVDEETKRAARAGARWLAERSEARRLHWDPTGDLVAARWLDLAGADVHVGGIPDAALDAMPWDLKVATGSGVALSWSKDSEGGARLSRGAVSVGEWVTRRHPAWATAAVMYAWVIGGWRERVEAGWLQLDMTRPEAPVLRVLRARLGPRWCRSVARRCRSAWEGLTAGTDGPALAQWAGMAPEEVAMLAG